MKTLKHYSKKLLRSQAGQGATEYILLLVIVVAIATMFKTQIVEAIKTKIGSVQTDLNDFKPQ
jgi:hypothetical protein